MKKKLLVLFSSTLIVVALYWVATHSYIEVHMQPGTNDNVIVELLGQSGNDKVVSLKPTGGIVKKIVARGQHEVMVKRDEASYFTVIKAGGWLGTAKVNAVPVSERQRQFVGDNPSPCGIFNLHTLISFGCADTFQNALVHVPATIDRPSYALKPAKAVDGLVEGAAQTNEGTVVVLKRLPSIDRDSSATHTAYVLNEKNELVDGVALTGLHDARTYIVSTYKQGLVLYNQDAGQLLYYSTRSSAPTEIKIETPRKMNPYSFNASGDNIVIAFAEADNRVDPDKPETAKIKGQAIIVDKDQKKRNIELDRRYSSLTVCGANNLCALLDKRLMVYDTSNEKSKLLYEIFNVDQVEFIGGRLILVRGKNILSLDVNKRSGANDFSLGEYNSCGLLLAAPKESTGYSVCMIDSRGKKVALLIDPSQPNKDSIDKKIAELLKTSEIKNLTIYGQFITVTPNAGQPVYDRRSNEYRYAPERVQSASSAINQAIDRMGIDRTVYKVNNTLD